MAGGYPVGLRMLSVILQKVDIIFMNLMVLLVNVSVYTQQTDSALFMVEQRHVNLVQAGERRDSPSP